METAAKEIGVWDIWNNNLLSVAQFLKYLLPAKHLEQKSLF